MFASVSSSGFLRRFVGLCVKSYGCVAYASSLSGPPVHFFFAPLMRFSFLFTHTISRMNWSGGVEMFCLEVRARSRPSRPPPPDRRP